MIQKEEKTYPLDSVITWCTETSRKEEVGEKDGSEFMNSDISEDAPTDLLDLSY